MRPSSERQNVQVIVSSTDASGKTVSYAPYEFRVKAVPKPEARFGGKNSGTISRNLAVAQQGVFAVLPDFDFDLQWNVTGFTVLYSDKMGDFEEKSTSSNLTARQKNFLAD